MDKPPLPVLYTLREVAEAAKVSEVTVRRHVAKDAIEVVRIGGTVRVTREAAERYLGVTRGGQGGRF